MSLFLLQSAAAAVLAQSPPSIRGIAEPTTLRPQLVSQSLATLLGSVTEISSGVVAGQIVRVLGSHGQYAGQDCGCLTTIVHIVVRENGEEGMSRAYRLGELLDPTVDSIVSRNNLPVVFMRYGEPSVLRRLRATIMPSSIRIEPISTR